MFQQPGENVGELIILIDSESNGLTDLKIDLLKHSKTDFPVLLIFTFFFNQQ